jgi:hypothetical protein
VTRSNIRRAAALLSGAVAAGLLLSACGTGQVAETSLKVPPTYGVNTELQVEGGTYKVRNAAVVFTEGGYESGSDAPLEVALFNDTGEAVTVRVSSEAAGGVRLVDPNATPSPSPTPSRSPSRTPSESPSESPSDESSESPSEEPSAAPSEEPAAPAGPATIEIPANGFVLLNRADGPHLELVGLRSAIESGEPVPVTFDFGGEVLETQLNLGVPLSPLPRPSSVVEEEEH